jgi:spore coat protein U-like protein
MNRPMLARPVNARRALRAAAMCVLLLPGTAAAAPKCDFLVATALAFGRYDPTSSAPLDASAQIQYGCPPGQPVRISIDAGQSGTFVARELRSGAERLRYNLFLDGGHTMIWGDGTGGSSIGPLVRDVAQGVVTAWVFGRIAAGQDAAPGTYGDTLRVTLEL